MEKCANCGNDIPEKTPHGICENCGSLFCGTCYEAPTCPNCGYKGK